METNTQSVNVSKWSKRSHLWIYAFPEEPVFGSEMLVAFHGVLKKVLSHWCRELLVAKNPDAKPVSIGLNELLGSALHQTAPLKQGLGSAVLKGAYKGVRIYLDSWDGTAPPELNMIMVEVCQRETVEGMNPPEWAMTFFEALAAAVPLRYGNVRLNEEFNAKNMLNDENGLRAIGVKLDVSLPGLYWLNYFGKPYLDLIGEERLMAAPVYSTQRIGSGVMIALDDSPFAWPSAAYQEREQATIKYLGPEYFFQRDVPDRKQIAPQFNKL